MPVLTATGSWLFDFQARMRAVWRHYVFRRRVIRQKNGADTLYTPHTSRRSGDLPLTNEELPRVASRRREVLIQVQYAVSYSFFDVAPPHNGPCARRPLWMLPWST